MRELPYEGITGGKTGYVPQSGITLITTAKRGDLSVIAVTLKAANEKSAYQDTVELLDFAFANFKVERIPKGNMYYINNNAYKTDKALYYSMSNNEKIKEHVSKKGLLEIKNQNQELLASFQLKKVEEQKEEVAIYEELEKEPIDEDSNIKFLLSGFLILLFGIFYLSDTIKYISIFRK